ncbi:hypothetical protein PsorP6_005731 [Peronosclerospora sorghi]|uniref:Uncharacterized protein n=1 Tax=Peronosclerospora sorghi TaxID=230839 RepID=A0ACC0W5K7_9STRA|nr:hypothetical protein PsorP6_005731 [Peronosclerospora sorghi]
MTDLTKYFNLWMDYSPRQEVQYTNSLRTLQRLQWTLKDLILKDRVNTDDHLATIQHRPEPEPMEVDNVQASYGARRDGCWNCGRHGYTANNCRKHVVNSTRDNRQEDLRSHSTKKMGITINALEEVDEEKYEEQIVFDEYAVATVECFETKKDVAQAQEKEETLIRNPGSIEGKEVIILLDCGASIRLICEGIAKSLWKVLTAQKGL